MKKIEIFSRSEFGEIETILIDDAPYFKAIDVCNCLGYVRQHSAIQRHVHKDDSVFRGVTDSLGREQQTIFINESGLYALIMRSKRDEAMAFQRWVTSEVLPTIRKNGYYVMSQKHEAQLLVMNNHMVAQEQAAKTLTQSLRESKDETRVWREKAMELENLKVTSPPPVGKTYTTTEIAEELGTTAQAIHKHLEKAGVIEKYGIAWTLCIKYYGQGLGRIEIKSFKPKMSKKRVKTEILKWSEEGRRFIFSICNGIDLDEIQMLDESHNTSITTSNNY